MNANQLTVTRAKEIARKKASLTGVFDPYLAILAAQIDEAGGALIPPFCRGGHTRIVWPEGEESLGAFLERMRWQQISLSKCAKCNAPMALPSERPYGSRRGPRTNRRYCSNACRQAAYRERKLP